MKYYINLILIEFNLYKKNIEQLFISLIFILFLSLFFPFVITPDIKILSQMGINLFWLALILIHITSQNTIYKDDHKLGLLHQYFLSTQNLPIIIWIKNTINWLSIIIPFLLITPLIRLTLHFDHISLNALFIVITITSFILHSISTLVNLITLLFDNRNNLIGLLLIPSYIPVTIISLNYLQIINTMLISTWLPQLIILIGLCLMISTTLPFVIIFIIKNI